MAFRAKFRKNGPAVETSQETPQLAFAGVPDIVEMREQTWGSIFASWIKSIILFILLVALVLTVIYTALAATVLFVTVVDGKTTMVARGTFLGGIPEQGDKVLISQSQDAPQDILQKIQVGFLGVSDPAVYTVVSKTAYDQVVVSNGAVTVAGEPVQGEILDDKTGQPVASLDERLNNEVVLSCLGGSCKAGSITIVSPNRIFGEVKPFKVGL